MTTDGRIDPSLMVLVSNIIQSTNRQGYDYLEGLDKYITGSGQGRYLRDLFTIKDGVYNIDPETLAREREKIWILLEEQMKNILDVQKKNKKNFKEEKTILIKHVKRYKVVKKELLLLPVGLVRKLPTISWHVK